MSKNKENKTCLNCGKQLSGWQTKFCCKSCAATYNNKLRGPMSEETKEKIKNTLLEKYPPKPIKTKEKKSTQLKPKQQICIVCGKIFENNKKRKTCSDECNNILTKTLAKEYQSKRHKECYKYYLEHQEEFCRPNYIPKQFKQEFIEEQGGRCAICGMKPEWNGKPIVFIMDHIDGDASNNRRDNLRCICPNCDSQLDTYKSKNKNSKRTNYWKNKIIKDLQNKSNCN